MLLLRLRRYNENIAIMAIWRPLIDHRPGTRAAALVEALADDIAAGLLQPGERLPPQRDLARALGLSPNTVMRAYSDAVGRGLVAGEVGRGTYVRQPQKSPSLPLGLKTGMALERPAAGGPIDFSMNLPFVGEAAEALRTTLGELAREPGLASLLDHQDPQARGRHENAGALWIRRFGPAAGGDTVVVSNGAQQGIFAALLAVLKPGDTMLAEALTYAPLKTIARHLGVKIKAVAIDGEGLIPEALEAACHGTKAKLLYLTPTLHTPTTAILGEERRRRIARLAAAHDLLLVEDDVFGFLPDHRPPPIAVHAGERTIFVTSLSKCVAPGLRIGYVFAPEAPVPAIRSAVALSSWMPPPLMAELASRFIEDGTAAQLAERQRRHAARRQVLAREILAGHEFAADPHGMHLWLPLPESWPDEAFANAAREQGVLVQTARTFAAGARTPDALRLCLSHEQSDERVERGLRLVAGLLGRPGSERELVP
jgi:DNA-binding transcriptional MocR family regulator